MFALEEDVCTPIKHLYDNGYLLVIVEVPILSWPSLHVLLNMCLNFELLSGWLFQIELRRKLLLSTILACTQIWHYFHCLAYMEQLGFGDLATKSLLWLSNKQELQFLSGLLVGKFPITAKTDDWLIFFGGIFLSACKQLCSQSASHLTVAWFVEIG